MLHTKSAFRTNYPELPNFIAVIIGGSTKSYKFSAETAEFLSNKILAISAYHSLPVFISFSRRTPQDVKEIFKNKFPEPHMIYDTDGNLPNPYPGIIGEGEYIIITADSISMCSEAASTGVLLLADNVTNINENNILRSSTAVLIGMVAGFVTIIYFKVFSKVDSIIPGMLGNLIFFMGSHYILGEKGGTVLIAFLKPKQEQNQLTEDKVLHLGNQLQDHAISLEKALKVKSEFLQNIEHEGHTPITGITTTGQVLYEYYDQLSEKERKEMARNIAKSSDRLLTLVNNLIDVSKLSTMKYQLNKTQVNLSELLYDRLEYCKKLYLEQKNLNFLNRIEDNILIECDRHYITSAIDSLIVNAIKHTREGDITIGLHRSEFELKFSISNGGEIPKEELNTIFEPFTIGSNSRTKSGAIPNGQRGLGLALCKLAIEAHGGKVPITGSRIISMIKSMVLEVIIFSKVNPVGRKPRTKVVIPTPIKEYDKLTAGPEVRAIRPKIYDPNGRVIIVVAKTL
eukprot:jgi/Mesvir1/25246/Mv20313-RA.1